MFKEHYFTAIDLFSGCGGLTTGLKRAGFRVLAAVEIDSLAASTYRDNHPDVNVFQHDIRGVSGRRMLSALRLRKGELDLLAGCPPCQGFSTIRTLNGGRRVRDGGKDLVFEFLRLVRSLRPKAIMMENVPGLARDRRLRSVVNQLQRLGYTCEYRVLDAADFGVPQRRKRMILLGSRFGPVRFAHTAKRTKTVRDSIGGLPPAGTSRDALHGLLAKHGPRVASFIRRIARDGGSRTQVCKRDQLSCHKATTGFKDVYGRMAWDKVAPTITTGCINPSKGRFLHPSQNRAITLREAALLQTFPRSYKFSLASGKFAAAALIGNALPPEFIRRHAVKVVEHLRTHAHQVEKIW